MSIKETTIQLSNDSRSSEFEGYVNQIQGVERSMIDLDTMNAVIQYDSELISESELKSKIFEFK
ncbi:hypothetical protein FZW96_06245 [Bacillus sp. BGMRC 2118]|nr:hypothetical protein FZW96_06245 [Bacillus sp. BGMRC 2118]